MIIETLSTGDEIVNGDVIDTNSAYLSQKLVREGYLTSRHNAVADDERNLVEEIGEIAARADFCVCSGGLGPTEDDLTADVVAKVLGVPVFIDEKSVKRMQERFASFNLHFTENNRRSARYPEGAIVYKNEVGTAPAFSIVIKKCQFFFLPGVPKEFIFFIDTVVLPWIRNKNPAGFGAVVQLKTVGHPEAHVADMLHDLPTLFPKIKLGYRATHPEVWVKLTREGVSRSDAMKEIEPAIEVVKNRLGAAIFAVNLGDALVDEASDLPFVVHKLLLKQNLKLVTAESCTGGMISELLTHYAGSSAYLKGGIVAYSNELKTQLLDVPAIVFETNGAVSAECASAMAKGAIQKYNADIAVSVTGIAGPAGGTPNKPVGLVYTGLAVREGADGKILQVVEQRFRGDRERVRRSAAYFALDLIRRQLMNN